MKNNHQDLSEVKKILENFSFEDVTAAIFLDVRKSKDNGNYPVKIRVTHNRKQHYYPSVDISLDDWNTLLEGKNPRGKLLDKKKLMYASFKTLTDIIKDLAPGKHFTFEGFNLRLSRGADDSILTAFDNKIAFLHDEGRIGSKVWYSCALSSIKNYTDKDVKYSDVTVDWLKGYQKHMVKEGNKDTTISINMRALRAVVNDGLRSGIISPVQYPFGEGKFQIPTGEGRKLALTTSQLMDVFNYPLLPQDEKWRDLWIFSFYCSGANLNDILRFRYENVKGNVIEWYRQKTLKQSTKKRLLRAIITPEMRMIIEKYGNERKPSNYIFPYLSEGLTPTREREIIHLVIHSVNKKMKKIGDALGIDKLTSYAARHSFASISRRSGVDLFNISKSMGHATLKTTEIYLDSLSDEDLVNNAAKLPRMTVKA